MKRAVLLLVAMCCFLGVSLKAQDTANIVGTVMDNTGAVIPGAKVTVQNPEKGYVRNLVSNAAGEYSVSAIPIGNYVVTAEASGFQKLVRSGITLTVGQIQRVDLRMTVGQVTQEVTVTGNVPHVQTETAAISDVITGQQISQLELNGRNFVTLALLVPGASPDNGLDTSHVGVYGNNSISFNGSRTQYNNWEVDGGNNTDEGSAGTFNTYPNLDTIAEFRISTSNYGADMGKHAGATIEVATKSGTKDFHGDAFEFVRNDHFDANPWFQNQQLWSGLSASNCGGQNPGSATHCNSPKTPRKWNDYGYTIGGPVYIPGHYNTDKSKTFFFWSEDWRKYREGQVISNGVPSLLERQGDFSECDKASKNYNSVVASGCTLPKVGGVTYDTIGQIPGLDPVAVTNAQDLLNGLVPLPNNGPNGWILSSSTATNWRQEQIRVDENINDSTQLFVRYTQDAWNTLAVPALWSSSNFDTIKTPFGGPGKSAVLHLTHSFRPNLMNEFVMAYTADHILLYNQPGTSCANGPCQINRPSNFQLAHFFPANGGNPLLPSVCVGGGGTGFCEDAGNHPWFNSNPIITWKDNVGYTVGKHSLKFGMFLEKYRKNEQFGANTQGFLQFQNWGSNSTGNGLADMFLGRITQYNEGTQTVSGVPVGGYPKGHWRMTDFEPYIQDDWKVSHKLTLNLGLRYYWLTRIHDVTRPTVDSGFLPNLYNPANEAQYDANGNLIQGTGHIYTTFGNGLVECGHNGIPLGCQLGNSGTNFAPRFGFAYDPFGTGKTVIRGGYGIYYEMGNGNEAQSEGGEGNPPVSLSPSNFNVTGYENIVPVYVNGQYAAPLGPTGYTAWPYSQPWGSEQQFSFGVQHEFGANNLFSLEYVGMLGRHLARNRNLTQIPLGEGTVNVPQFAGDNYCDAQGNCNVQNFLIHQTGNAQFFQPYRGYSGISMKENTSVASYHSLQANLRHTFGHGLTFQAAYTWAHNIDDSTSTYSSSANSIDDSHLSRWKGTSDLNRAQVLTMNYIYDLPFFKNSSNRFSKGVLGGWEISGITTLFTGEPVDIRCGINGFSTGISGSVRCNSAGALKVKKGVFNDPTFGPITTWFDGSTYTQPEMAQLYANNEPGMFGYMGRNTLTGPGRNNTDLALMKNISLPWFNGEHSTMQFRWETFNSFNHPEWKGINAGCDGSANPDGSPAFGRPCNDTVIGGNRYNAGNGQVNSAWPNRIMQLGLKFIF